MEQRSQARTFAIQDINMRNEAFMRSVGASARCESARLGEIGARSAEMSRGQPRRGSAGRRVASPRAAAPQ